MVLALSLCVCIGARRIVTAVLQGDAIVIAFFSEMLTKVLAHHSSDSLPCRRLYVESYAQLQN